MIMSVMMMNVKIKNYSDYTQIRGSVIGLREIDADPEKSRKRRIKESNNINGGKLDCRKKRGWHEDSVQLNLVWIVRANVIFILVTNVVSSTIHRYLTRRLTS